MQDQNQSIYCPSTDKSTRKSLLVDERVYGPKRFARVLMFQYYWKSEFFLTFCVFHLRILAVSVGVALLQLVSQNSDGYGDSLHRNEFKA